MSPRSGEFVETARRRLRAARAALEEDPGTALSAAYYAMLYAARGALSERDAHVRTHRGTWDELRERYVLTGALDEALFVAAHRVQPVREDVDYDAQQVTADEAQAVIDLAERFIAAVVAAIDPPVS
jgi:uncharacterized protein (UPF0332 family)